jgi:ubiquitin-conjugating enzyme E2 J2
MSNYSQLTIKRINGEIKQFLKMKMTEKNLENIMIYPNPDNILEIYFLIKGDPESPFNKGEYMCKLIHNPSYPLKAPDYHVLTPNGRFEINRNICLTNSAFHQGDWAPAAWNLLTLLNGFYSIWHSTSPEDKVGIGHLKKEPDDIIKIASESKEYNKLKLTMLYNTITSISTSTSASVST